MALPETIAAAYKLFAPYTIGTTLEVCKACCISDAEEAELVRTPLRETSSRLLWHAYYESARCYSDRELWEMKHFLPRVLELVAHFDFPCHSPEIVFTRLDFDKSEKWLAAEVQLLEEYAILLFKKSLETYAAGEEGAATYLVMFGIAHFNLAPLLALWEATETLEGLLYFKDLVLHELDYKSLKPYRLGNAFATPAVSETVVGWLQTARVKALFARRIEAVIMEEAGLPAETVAGLSWVYEFLVGG